ncbi:polyphosphate kinase 2 family protein [Methanoregula sp.]|uniref:polyphosphate kinase 2 family protein n=1 Tax=Methanoregula sp. TaxID=2052170 RepID=UPI00236BE51D|nr:polyphosphate kinase 2 family protein [Methanoregula sp.]MDD1685881.1 polyphosphate kinase 2 family protein [Methanoregula sp.]
MTTTMNQLLDSVRVPPGKKIDLRNDYDPGSVGQFMSKQDAQDALSAGIQLLAQQQDKLYAQNTYALLVILQAMDAAGKDSTIKHVMSGVNPQGVQVTSFKVPSIEELDHDYLWRCSAVLPKRGNIGIFNRSYYEEVLVPRVHPEYLERQQLPPVLNDRDIWDRRFREINNFERYLFDNGIVVLKLFLNISKEEQKRRFIGRVDEPDKNWKFSAADIRERACWDQYMDAYEEMFNHTSTPYAPWYIIPADHKWFTRLAVISAIYETLDRLHLAYPKVTKEQKEALLVAKAEMEKENGDAAGEKKKAGKRRGKNT